MATGSAKSYVIRDDNQLAVAEAAAKGRVTDWPTKSLASSGIMPTDSRAIAEEKGIAVFITVANTLSFGLHVLSWSSTTAAVVWSVFVLVTAVGVLGTFVATKEHKWLRIWNMSIGVAFFITAFLSERCQPLSSTQGRILVPLTQSVIFLPLMGVPNLAVGGLSALHAVLYITAAIVDGAGATCFSKAVPLVSNTMGAIFVQLVLPLIFTSFAVLNLLRNVHEQQHQDALSESFGIDVIKAAQRNDVDAIERAVQAYDDRMPLHPSMTDDAIGVMLETVKYFKKLAPHDVSGLSRKGSLKPGGASSTDRSPAPQFLTAPDLAVSVNASRSSNDSSAEEIAAEDAEAAKQANRLNAQRRRSSRVTLLDTDGEVSTPNALGIPARGMRKQGTFIVAFALPRLQTYASRGIASLDLVKIFMSEFVDHVYAVAGEYDGITLFNSFTAIYMSFEHIGNACAAAVQLLERMKKDASHHKDQLLNDTKAHKPFVVILHAELMHGTVGSESIVSAGYSPAERVFNKIIDVFPNTTAMPPSIVVAASLRTIASEGFIVEDGPHPALCFVTGAKSLLPDGTPFVPPPSHVVTATDEYSLPEFDDVPGEIATNIIERGRANDEAQRRKQSEIRNSSLSQHPADGHHPAGQHQLQQRPSTTSSASGRRKHRLPPEVLDVWKRYDVDGNGHLDVDEVRDMLEEMGMKLDDEELKEFFESVDHDSNGVVTLEEFQAAFFSSTLGGQSVMAHIRRGASAMAANTGGDNLPIVLNAWKKYDADGSGALEAKEISLILSDLGMTQTEEEVEWLVQKLDRNGNGKIDFDEFAALFSEDDGANKKLNVVKERIQTVTRVMMNKSSGKIYSNEMQDLRDKRNRVAAFVDDYCSLPLFAYCVYNAGQTTYRIALGEEEIVPLQHIIIDLVLDLIMVFWMLAKLFIIPIEIKGQVIFTSKEILCNRVRTREFWIDVLIVLPLDFVFLAAGRPGVIGYWRANKILLAYYIDPLYNSISRKINPAAARALNAGLFMFMFCHVFSSLCIVVARDVGEVAMDDMVGSKTLVTERGTTYLKSLYWAIMTLAGQIKGAAIPKLENQVYLLMAATLVGLPMFTVVLGAVGNAANVEDSYTRFLGKIDELRGYFEYTKLPATMEVECVAYYYHLYNTTGTLDITEDPLDDLPVELSIQVTIQIGRDMLKKVPIFKDASNNLEFVHELTTKLVPRVIEPGALVMRKGDRGSNMYFVTHGDFNIVIDDGTVVFTLRKGNFFGEIALLHNVKRTATIVCGGRYANVLILDKKHFDEVTTTFPDCLSQVYKAAEDRIKQMLEKEKEEAQQAKEKRRREREEARRKAIEDGEEVGAEQESDSDDADANERAKEQRSATIKRTLSSMAQAMVKRSVEERAGGAVMARSQSDVNTGSNGSTSSIPAVPTSAVVGSRESSTGPPNPASARSPTNHGRGQDGARLSTVTFQSSDADEPRPTTAMATAVSTMHRQQSEEEAFPEPAESIEGDEEHSSEDME